VWTHDDATALRERRQASSARKRPGRSGTQPRITERRNEMVVWTSFFMATPIGEGSNESEPRAEKPQALPREHGLEPF
jgi:hypothetical protein